MKILKIAKKIFLFIFILQNFLFCGFEPASFLELGFSARANSLGKAFVSILSDPSSVFYNPAGISGCKDFYLGFSADFFNSKWDTAKDIMPKYNSLYFVLPTKNFFNFLENPVFGFGLINYSLDKIPYTYVEYIDNEDFYIVRDETSLKNNAYLLNFSDKFSISPNEVLHFGLGLRFVTQDISKVSSSFGWDILAGAIYKTDFANFGFVINRGLSLTWSNGETDLGPLCVKYGISKDFEFFKILKVLVSADLIQKQKYPLTLNFGFETEVDLRNEIVKSIFFRAGVENFVLENRYNYKEFFDKSRKFCFGLGGKFSYNFFVLSADYVFSIEQFGNKHKISVTISR
jgi:hypothetical protein